MKINVEFDLTPEEFRESLGLPNLEAFQRNMMDRIQQQMEAGVAGYDPWSLMKPFMQSGSQSLNQGLNQGLSQGMANFGNYQQMMMDMFRQAGSNAMASSSSKKEDSQKEDSKKRMITTRRVKHRRLVLVPPIRRAVPLAGLLVAVGHARPRVDTLHPSSNAPWKDLSVYMSESLLQLEVMSSTLCAVQQRAHHKVMQFLLGGIRYGT
ncbi:hypothetical protein [Halomonas sp. PR-M31]|uniref:hypothetical protein n=1 Tax=Halomonas sp. PR-M31 TaxID=1471202 RepID=UPI000AA802AF